MRIAISATGTDLAAQVDPRFGRSKHFIIFDPETLQHEAVDNSNAAAGGGAAVASFALDNAIAAPGRYRVWGQLPLPTLPEGQYEVRMVWK